ncbi:MAG: hypothetical protein ACE5G6_08085, partial [Terriglobia bacterium]
WVLGEARTLEGVGRAQGATVHEGKLYVYGDAASGVIVEFTLDLQPTGRRIFLTRGGHDLISHPTGLTFHPQYGTYIGDSLWGWFGRGADIYQIDWERALVEGNLDHAVRAKIKDDRARSGTRPEFVRLGERWLLATADYREDSEVRLYDPVKLRNGGKTSEEGVLVGSFQLKGRTQSLVWEDETGWLYCVQNPGRGRGWRIVVLDLEKAQEAGRSDAPGVLIEQIEFDFDSELEGLAFLGSDRALFLTSDRRNNARLARLEPLR